MRANTLSAPTWPTLLLAASLCAAGCDGVTEQAEIVPTPVDDTTDPTPIPTTDPAIRDNLYGRIVFVSKRSGKEEVYAINADGSDIRRLTTGGHVDTDPSWSPDGKKIAFSRANNTVMIMDEDGSNLTQFRDGRQPSWSPTGATIAYGGQSIRTAPSVGEGPTFSIVVAEPQVNESPSWSPDGQQLAFASDWAAYDFAMDIYTVNVDGTGRRQRTHGFNMWPDMRVYVHPAWSPDGSMIAFAAGSLVNAWDSDLTKVGFRFRIAILSADSDEIVGDIAWAGDIPWIDVPDPGSLSWSPDGRGIAYSFINCDLIARDRCSNERSIRYVSLDGEQHTTIVADGHSPSWRGRSGLPLSSD